MKIEFVKQEKGSDLAVYEVAEGTRRNIFDAFDFKAEFNTTLIVTEEDKRILYLGIGKEKELSEERIRRAYSTVINQAVALKAKSICIQPLSEKYAGAVIEGILLSNYSFDKYKTKKEEKKLDTAAIVVRNPDAKKFSETIRICQNVLFVRDLVNENSELKNPVAFAKFAEETCKNAGVKCRILQKSELEKHGFGLLLAVSRGSNYPPQLVVMEYHGGKAGEKIAFVGKGITFDSGGLNLKPTGYIETMRGDMAGAATVLGIMKTAAELELPVNIVGVMALCENMIGPSSYKPGDSVKSYKGKTVEIANTDAEGRLILADALAFSIKELKATKIVDLATLTGAVRVALGDYATGLLTNNAELAKQFEKAGEKTGELVWQLPLWDDFSEDIKGSIADLKNIGGDGKSAGTIYGAAFLKEFVDKTPWVHLDIAATAWYDKPRYYMTKGGTGAGLRLIMEWLKR